MGPQGAYWLCRGSHTVQGGPRGEPGGFGCRGSVAGLHRLMPVVGLDTLNYCYWRWWWVSCLGGGGLKGEVVELGNGVAELVGGVLQVADALLELRHCS